MKTNMKQRFNKIIASIAYFCLPVLMLITSPILLVIWFFTGYNFGRFLDDFLDWHSLIMAGNQHAKMRWRQ